LRLFLCHKGWDFCHGGDMVQKLCGILFATLVFTLAVTTTAWAQETTLKAGLPRAGETPVSTSAPSSMGQGVSRWGASFFSIGSLSQGQIETGGASYSAYSYLGLNYKLNETRSWSLRPVFNANSEGLDKSGKKISADFSWGDAHLVYSDKEIATLGPVGVSTNFKLYLPTSEFSRQVHTVAIFRPETFVAYDLGGKMWLTWVIKPDFFIQSQTTFEDRSSPPVEGSYKRKATSLAALDHYLEFKRELNKVFAIKPYVGFKENWTHAGGSSDLKAAHNTSAKLGLGIDLKPLQGVSFSLLAENLVRVSNRADAVKYFRSEDNSLILITTASL